MSVLTRDIRASVIFGILDLYRSSRNGLRSLARDCVTEQACSTDARRRTNTVSALLERV
jgi:hypothetical protein